MYFHRRLLTQPMDESGCMSHRSGAMVFTICGAGLSAGDYERAMKWKNGYSLERLREALNGLAEHKG